MSVIEANWMVELHFGTNEPVLRQALTGELVVGRSEKTDTMVEGFDLTVVSGEERGVSRRHAMFRDEGDYVSLTDLSSSNGTYYGGTRLAAGRAYPLKDGDSVQFGQLTARVAIIDSLGPSTVRASQEKLNLREAPKLGRGQRILVVEDDPRTTELYGLMLKRAGYMVQSCREVVSAIRAINQSPPAIVLLDLLLPSLNGMELCRYIRRDTEAPSMPIIIMSALSDQTSVQQAMDAGADVFLNKPPNYKELVRVIGALLHKQETERNQGVGTRMLETPAVFDSKLNLIVPTTSTLVLFIEGERDPISMVVGTQLMLGRGSSTSTPSVDLDTYGAYDRGVSRNHAIIKKLSNGTFTVEDLGSSNGTYVNNYRVGKSEVAPLEYGDELRLGQMRIVVYMLIERAGGGK
jgi:pSer/pThr/pTyr-binding forkhead associated (FHA) protein